MAFHLIHEKHNQGGCGGPALVYLEDPTESLGLTIANTTQLDGGQYKAGKPFVCCTCGEVLGRRFLRVRNFVQI